MAELDELCHGHPSERVNERDSVLDEVGR